MTTEDSMAKCDFCRFSHPTLNSLTLYVVLNAPWFTSEARSCVLRMIVKLACAANENFSLRSYTERRRVQNKHYVGFWWVGGGIAKYQKKSLSRAECRTNEVNQHSASRIRQQCWKAPALSVFHVPIATAIAIGCNFIYLSAKCSGAEAQIGDTVKWLKWNQT